MRPLFLSGCTAILIFISLHTSAQTQPVTQDTLTWQVNTLTDLAADSTANFSCTFITYGTSRIVWLQKEGTFVTEFNVSSVQGTWADVQQPGSITYHVSCC